MKTITMRQIAIFTLLTVTGSAQNIYAEQQRGNIYDRNNIPLAESSVDGVRQYSSGESISHIVGYFAENKGRYGLEKIYEKELAGGNNLTLALDSRLQNIAYASLKASAQSGAVIAMKVDSGEVLAAVSVPGLPLTNFVKGISQQQWTSLLEDQTKPLLNKAVQQAVPPGSLFKFVTAFSALENNLITEETMLDCNEVYTVGEKEFRCWRHQGHGKINLKQAIALDCHVFFYQLAEQLGIDKLVQTAKELGLGSKTGITLLYEKKGIIADKESRELIKKKLPWNKVNTILVGVGQGYNLVTPIQIARLTTTIASSGKTFTPLLVNKITDSNDQTIKQYHPEIISDLGSKNNIFSTLQKGMETVANNKFHQLFRKKYPEISVAAMGGVSQVFVPEEYRDKRADDLPWEYRNHRWFSCYTPAKNPQIVITVFIDHGGKKGPLSAEAVALDILDKYLPTEENYKNSVIQ